MSSAKAIEALRQYRADQSTAKQRLVLEAIELIAEDGGELTVAAVCRVAGVSREFAYSHRSLVDAIRQRARAVAHKRPLILAEVTMIRKGTRADRNTLLEKVRRQAQTIEEQSLTIERLEIQRSKWLGEKLQQSVNPDTVEALRAANERLIAENQALTVKLGEQLELVSTLSGDLVASRRAHTEALAAATRHTGNVVLINSASPATRS